MTLSPDEAAVLLGVSRSTVLEWVRRGLLEKLPMPKVRVLRRSVESTTRITADLYRHHIPALSVAAAERMQEALSG